ncbi:MAG: WD40 repeat domain-containing protein, partial [Chloroflexota bacterium]
SRLAQFEGWAEETSLALTDQEKLFLQSSLEDEAKRLAHRAALERRSRNFLRALVGVMAVAAVIAIVLSIYAFNQQGIAQSEADSRATQQVIAEGREKARATQQAIAEAAQEKAQSMALAEAQAREEAERSLRLSTSNELVAFTLTELEKLSDKTHSLLLLLAREAVLTTLEADGYVTSQAEATLSQAIKAAPVLVRSLASEDDYIYYTFWSPDGKKIITVGDRTRVWDAESGKELLVLADGCGQIYWAKWSPDGEKILSTSSIYLVKLDSDGEKISSTSLGGCLSIWDAQTGDEELSLQDYFDPGVPDWSPDGTKIAAPIDEFEIVWDAQTGEQLFQKPKEADSWAVSYSPDGDRFAATSINSIKIFNSRTGE